MKKTAFLILCAATAAALASCSVNRIETDDHNQKNETTELNVTAGLATRAVDQTWTVGDRIGVIAAGSVEYLNCCYLLDETEATTSGHFSAAEDHTIYLSGGSPVTFTAYAPYQETDGPAISPGTDGLLSGLSTASQAGEGAQEALDFLFASGQEATTDNPKVNFTFTHRMAKLILKIVYGEGFSPAIIQYDDNDFQLGGLLHNGSFNVTDGTAASTGDATDSWDLNSGSVKENIDDGVRFTSIIFPQTPSSLTITLKINDEQFDTTPLTVPAGGFAASSSYTYTITVNENGLIVGTEDGGCEISSWDAYGENGEEDYQVNIGGN